MDICHFKSGVFINELDYKCFSPEPINQEWLISDPRLNTKLAKAYGVLGELNAYSQLVPNIDLFITTFIGTEAVCSSRIAGITLELEECFMDLEDIASEKRQRWQEVQNYIQAINTAIEEIKNLPLSSELIRKTHRILLQRKKVQQENPGEYRQCQNWFGASLNNAVFVPPVYSKVGELMSDLDGFIHNDAIFVPELLKLAISHYQFETIQPFLEGNGRLGRLLILLYLIQFALIKKPVLCLSDFLEKNRDRYYGSLMTVRITNDLSQWVGFLLDGIIESSKKSLMVLKAIMKLRERVELTLIPALGSKKQKTAKKLITALFERPVISSNRFAKEFHVSYQTSSRMIKDFSNVGILKESHNHRKNKLYYFHDYVNLFLS